MNGRIFVVNVGHEEEEEFVANKTDKIQGRIADLWFKFNVAYPIGGISSSVSFHHHRAAAKPFSLSLCSRFLRVLNVNKAGHKSDG